MEVMKTYKFRIYPNGAQRERFARQFGACRFVYNHFLRARIDYYAAHKDDPMKKGLTYRIPRTRGGEPVGFESST